MAVDYGDRHTGVAVSDPTGLITGFTTVVNEYNADRTAAEDARLAVEHGAKKIVVGHPVNMNGSHGPRAEKAEKFADMLRGRSGVEIIMWDERLTSVDANRILSDAGKKRGKQKKLVDAVAASLILQGYLDFLKR